MRGALALAVSGAGLAVAAPPSGSIESIQDLKGAWLTSLTGFREGEPISWLHRLMVRKVKGSVAVAWEEWLDCTVQAAECKAAKAGNATRVNWSAPSRVLMAMDSKGVVHGIGANGSMMLTSDEQGMSAVMLSSGQRDNWTATPDPTTSGQLPTAPRQTSTILWTGHYVATGSTTWYPNY